MVYFSVHPVQPVIPANKHPMVSNRARTPNVAVNFRRNFAAEVNRNLREIRHRNLQQKRGMFRKPPITGRKASIPKVGLLGSAQRKRTS